MSNVGTSIHTTESIVFLSTSCYVGIQSALYKKRAIYNRLIDINNNNKISWLFNNKHVHELIHTV